MYKITINIDQIDSTNPRNPTNQTVKSVDLTPKITSGAEKEFGFRAKKDFREGLKKTIDWYLLTKETKKTM